MNGRPSGTRTGIRSTREHQLVDAMAFMQTYATLSYVAKFTLASTFSGFEPLTSTSSSAFGAAVG